LAEYRLLIANHAVEIGGAERVLLRFLERIDRGLFEPALACPHAGPLSEEAAKLGLQVHFGYPAPRLLEVRRKSLGAKRLAALAYPWDMARTVLGLARLLRGGGYDLVLTNSAKADIYGSLAARLTGIPVVWRLHDIVDADAFSRLNIMLFRFFATFFAAKVLAVSEAVRSALAARGVSGDKIAVVYNGIDIKALARTAQRKEARAEWGLEEDAPVAGMVGRLVDWKGPDRFLEAAARVAGEIPQARFMLVGDAIFGEAGYVDELKAMADRLGLGKRAVFTGFRDDALRIMSGLDVLVHASLLPDPLPTVLIEAMALGLPVVAADAGGVREIVDEGSTGLVVPPGDVRAMSEAMVELLSDPEVAARMGEAGRELAAERFDIEGQARRFEGEMLSVLPRGKLGSGAEEKPARSGAGGGSTRMRIGVEGRTLQGERYGVARYLVNLLRNLVELEGEEEYVVYLSEPIVPLDFSSPRMRLEILGHAPGLTWRHLRLPLSMRRDKVDLHYSPSYFLPLVKVCPSVVVVHDLTFKVHPEWFAQDRRFRYDDLFWREVKRAERIITVSEYSKGDITRILGVDPSRVTVVHGAPDPFFQPVNDEARLAKVRDRYGLEPGFLFTVGAIHTRRNLERLIEAVSGASRDLGEELQLLIIGTPASFTPPVDIWGTARRCGMESRLRHVEFIPEEDLLLLYNACGLFVYPSLYEGFGLPVIEAMACGTPVVCSGVTSLPEIAGDAALFFDPLSVEEMTQRVAGAMSDAALREELRRAGKARAASFSWRKTAEETLRVFREILEQR
jgi:glycosyltransferase involved in cell wall biosynthesis